MLTQRKLVKNSSTLHNGKGPHSRSPRLLVSGQLLIPKISHSNGLLTAVFKSQEPHCPLGPRATLPLSLSLVSLALSPNTRPNKLIYLID